MKAGYYTSDELSIEDYHADPAIGSTGITAFRECPAIYYHRCIQGNYEASNSARIGSYAHLALLEPDKFEQQYKVSPETSILNRGKSNEEEKAMTRVHGDWKQFAKEAKEEGKEPMLWSDFETCCNMVAVLKKNETANAALTGGRAEMSFFAKDDKTGLMLKARPDYLVKIDDLGVVLVDYKTTAYPLGVSKQSNHAFSLNRHIQAAHHKRVAEIATQESKIDEVIYVTQMQNPPYLVRIFRMPHEAIEYAEGEIQNTLREVAECYEKQQWPDYPDEIVDYDIPRWVNYELN